MQEHAFHPAGRVGRVEDIAGLVAFLVGPESGFITGCRIRRGRRRDPEDDLSGVTFRSPWAARTDVSDRARTSQAMTVSTH